MIEPAGVAVARGNAVTVARWVSALRDAGHDVSHGSADRMSDFQSIQKPDLIHAHHAVKSGLDAMPLAQALGCPLVISLGGTDAGASSPDPAGLPALREASVILGPFDADAERLGDSALTARFHRVRRGVPVPELPAPPRPHDTLKVLIAGALRPVKRQLEAVHFAELLRNAGLNIELSIVGPTLDDAYGRSVTQAVAAHDWCRFLGPIPAGDMTRIYGSADLVLNLSESEGASNALLEAWAHGLPVAATDVPGNRQMLSPAPALVSHLLPTHGKITAETLHWVRTIAEGHTTDREQIAEAARTHVRLHHNPADELRELVAAYRAG